MALSPRTLLDRLATGNRLRARNRIVYASLPSTNNLGKSIVSRFAQQGEALPPTVILALEQTAGHGRQGRPWLSPAGGIYASYLWPCQPQDLQLLPLRVALALRRALRRTGGCECELKWPNDLMAGAGKIGGILIETISGVVADRVGSVIGFGINHQPAAGSELSGAAFLIDHSIGAPAFDEVVLGLLIELEQELVTPASARTVVRRYVLASRHEVGERLICRTGRGVWTGTFRGFDERGFLLLETSEGKESISSGEILEPFPGGEAVE